MTAHSFRTRGALLSLCLFTAIDAPSAQRRRAEAQIADPGLARGIATADSLIQAAVEHTIPGAVLVVARHGKVLEERAFGWAELNDFEVHRLASPRPMHTSTLFDLASVTKVMATTMALMMLASDGRIDVDAPVYRYLPDFRGVHLDSITVRHLLQHAAGLVQWQPLYYHAANERQTYDVIRGMPLQWGVGEGRHYSDLGFMLLGDIVERVAGRPLDRYLAESLYGPLGLRATMFLPRKYGFTDVAATEQGNGYERHMVYDSTFGYRYRGDPTAWNGWRQYVLNGETDDGNAWYANGGVAGHAGLFSTAADLRMLLDLLVQHGRFGGRQYIRPETVDRFLTRDRYQNFLGWMSPNGLPDGSFSHTGFTGTYVLGVPKYGLSVVLLTNRQNMGTDARGYFPNVGPLDSLVARAIVSGAEADVGRLFAQDTSSPTERTAARAWFRDAKFGLFIHWGVYSQLGQGEWVMQNRSIPVDRYEWLASAFNPVKFSAREWVSLAKRAGVRYITITSRHHDGFSMFATKATRYNVVDWTPFARDPLKELADECRREGIKLFFYYSQLDWHHADYWPRGGTGHATGRPDAGDWNRYLDFMDQQLTELLTNYGPLGGIWFDGMWDKPNADWRLERTYALIHRLQPDALIIPNHHKAPLPGEDVQTFEQDLPGANTAGFNTKEIGSLPLETSLTMNDSWGFNITDTHFKSTRELIGYLVRAAGRDANLLLNIGPRPDGTIQPEAADRLQALGDWLRTRGRSIYATRGGPVAPHLWGVTTQRGDSVFVHVLDWPDRVLSIPAFGRKVVRASMLVSGERIQMSQTENAVTLTLPSAQTDEADRVIVLETTMPVRGS